MTRPEFDAWRGRIARAYADEQVAAGTWPAEEALQRALEDTAQRLPQGPATEGMLLLQGVLDDGTTGGTADGTVVGRLWIGLRHPRGTPDCAFLYDIEVDGAHRGRGLGRALLGAAEDVVRSHGIGALELNVFAENTRAGALYASAGYEVVTRQMRKALRP
ncbi:GNAT family N-acetyltransferase [Kineococcus sp. T13]|uniref:GNAT family N-acetyltransferase n=1 Tax=Kineococcus vitellinus TaxID=2696565 RepID=UPI001411BA91|nr:GNAT family N-acetyltransferase [Kineococcus vitellinus]NAZ76547.1 GNAT family N-acetyltransferase [Kineococcus vitellinus]